MKNVRKHRSKNLLKLKELSSIITIIQHYCCFLYFFENLLPIKIRKPQVLSKIVIYQFRHNCVKPKNDEKVKMSYMDKDCFFKDIVKDAEKRFATSN